MLGYLLLGFAFAHRLWPGASHRVLGSNTPDAELFAYFLKAVPHAVAGGHPFVVRELNAPVGVSMLWNTTLFLPALLLAPVTWLGGGLLSLNVLLTVAPALSAWSAFLCLRRFLPSAAARAVAGLVFGFSPAVVHQAVGGHLHEVVLWLVPPILLQVVRLVTGDGPPRRVGVLLGLLVAAQLLTGEEALAQTALMAVLLVLALALHSPRGVPKVWRGTLVGGLIAVGTALALTIWPLYEQFFGRLRQHGTPFVADYYRNDFQSFTTATPRLLQHSHADVVRLSHLHGGLEEQVGFLGPSFLVLLLLISLVLVRDLRARVVTFTGLGLGVLSLGTTLLRGGVDTHQWLPWKLVHNLPVAEALLPNRLSLLVALCAGILLALAIEAVHHQRLTIVALTVAIIAFCLVPLIPRPLSVVEAAHVPSFFRDGTAARVLPQDAAVLVLPFPSQYPVEPEAWQAADGFRFTMPGGYFLAPDDNRKAALGSRYRATSNLLLSAWFDDKPVAVTDEVRRNFVNDLAYWGTHAVLLGPTYRGHQVLHDLAVTLFGPPSMTYGSGPDEVQVWLNAKVQSSPQA